MHRFEQVKKINVGGWPHVALDRRDFALLMQHDCMRARAMTEKPLPKLAFSMNGQALSLAESDPVFRDAMQRADYIQADGQSLVIASRYLCAEPLPERIATTDFFHDCAKVAQDSGLSFYILGASQAQHDRALTEIRRLYPRLIIAGHRNGYFSADDVPAICADIVASGADVLWVGLGKPKEQLFCIDNLECLRGVGWIKSCGGLFDFLSGKHSRAPEWMQKYGLEWAYRLALEPRRLFWRYFVTNVHSLYLLLRRGSRLAHASS